MTRWQIDEYWYMSDVIFIIWGLAGLAYILLVCLIVLALFNKRMAGWKMLPVLIDWLFVVGTLLAFTGFFAWQVYKVIDGGYGWSTKIEIVNSSGMSVGVIWT